MFRDFASCRTDGLPVSEIPKQQGILFRGATRSGWMYDGAALRRAAPRGPGCLQPVPRARGPLAPESCSRQACKGSPILLTTGSALEQNPCIDICIQI